MEFILMKRWKSCKAAKLSSSKNFWQLGSLIVDSVKLGGSNDGSVFDKGEQQPQVNREFVESIYTISNIFFSFSFKIEQEVLYQIIISNYFSGSILELLSFNYPKTWIKFVHEQVRTKLKEDYDTTNSKPIS